LLVSALLLWRGTWLWECNRLTITQGLPPLALEAIFLLALGLAFLGLHVWLGSALDGGRRMALRSGRKVPIRGDYLTLVLLASCLAFALTLHPAKVANRLDIAATGMQNNEYRLIPLCMELVSRRLDPSQPKYLLESAKLYDALGNYEKARELRQALEDRWHVYATMLLQQDLASDNLLLPPAILSNSETTK